MPKSRKSDKRSNNDNWYEIGSGNIFKDLGHTDEDALNLLLRSDLLTEIANVIGLRGLSQAEAANILGVKQPRISELMNGRISKFKLDVLVKYLGRLGVRVRVTFDHGSRVA
jgi:predicted XRE-type DNA-binding protein